MLQPQVETTRSKQLIISHHSKARIEFIPFLQSSSIYVC